MIGAGFSLRLKVVFVLAQLAALAAFVYGLVGYWAALIASGLRDFSHPSGLIMLGGLFAAFVICCVAIVIDDAQQRRLPPPDQ